MHKLRKWLRDAIIIGGITFGVLELGLRALPWFVGEPLKSVILEARRIPLSNVRTHSGLAGGTRRLLPPPAPSDVLVVGDSIPFGTYVRDEDTFPARLQALTGLSVVNLSVGSQAPPQYNRMVELGLQYHPKLVLYCVFANDFLYDTTFEIRSPLSADRPFGALPDDRDLYITELSGAQRWAGRLKRVTNLSVSNQIRKLFQQPSYKYHSVRWSEPGLSFVFAPADYWDERVSWNRPPVREAVAVNTRLAEAARALTAAQNIRFVVVLLPSKEMVYGPLVGEGIYHPLHHETYRAQLAALRERGIKAVDLTDELRRLARARIKLFHTIDGHLNEEGHRRIADLLRGEVGAP